MSTVLCAEQRTVERDACFADFGLEHGGRHYRVTRQTTDPSIFHPLFHISCHVTHTLLNFTSRHNHHRICLLEQEREQHIEDAEGLVMTEVYLLSFFVDNILLCSPGTTTTTPQPLHVRRM
jgi:hypothetical protein